MKRRAGILLCLAAAAAVGLGAEAQRETYGGPIAGSVVRGYAVILTAIVAAGLLVTALALAFPADGKPGRRRALAAVFGGTTILLFLLQQAWINAVVPDKILAAQVSVSPLASNVDAAASLLVPILAVAAGAGIAIWLGLRRLAGLAGADHEAPRLALLPFLAVPAAGMLRIVTEGLPRGGESAYGPILVVLALVLAGISASNLWSVMRPGHALGGQWERRFALGTLFALTAVAFPFKSHVAALDRPLAFSMGLQAHTLLLILLLALVWPALRATNGPSAPARKAMLLGGTWMAAWGMAFVASFLWTGALIPWLASALAAAMGAWLVGNAAATRALLCIAAFATWCIGNTQAAVFNPGSGSGFLNYWPAGPDTPLVLTLWRLAALGLASAALLVGVPRGKRLRRAVAALGLGVVALMYLPMGIDTASEAGARAVTVGSILANQQAAVRWTMHALALAGALAAAWSLLPRANEPARA